MALISTIASTTTQSSSEAAAQEVCSSLVTHYSDPIHQSAGNGEVEHPYFHDAHSSLPCLPPVCEFWQRKLLEVDYSNELTRSGGANSADKNISLAVTQELLYCYETMIRPVLITDSDGTSVGTAAKIIEHYELLLAHRTQHHTIEETTAALDGVVKRLKNVHIRDDDKKYDDENSDTVKIGSIIHIISQDISAWTAKITHHAQTTTKKIQSCLVPYLLRLLEHSVALLLSSYGSNDDIIDKADLTAFKEALSIATVICVPFVGAGKSSSSGNFDIGTLMEWIYESNIDGKSNCNQFSITTALKCCSPTPLSVMDDSDLMSSSSFMMRPVVDLTAPSARFVASWSDAVAFKAATRLLKQIYTVSLLVAPSQDKDFAGIRESPDNVRSLLQTIGDNVGIEVLTSTVRAFFYGRLTHPTSSSSSRSDISAVTSNTPGPYMPMVRRIGTDKKEVNDTVSACTNADDLSKECKKLQLSAASLIFCTVLQQGSSNFTVHDDALSDAIPILLTMLDDTQPFHQALGAVIFLSAIESLSTSSSTESNVPSFVAKFNTFLTSTFETSIKQCGREDASLITIICYAQSKWIEYLSSLSHHPDCIVPQATVNTVARKAAADLLQVVRNQAQFGCRDGSGERIAGMLLAGINPLLAMLADLPDAAAVEIARVGLSAVLPLMAWRGGNLESHSVHIASMTCLLLLMNGAFPIMPKHGGKILTEVLLLLDRIDKDTAYLIENNAEFPHDSDDYISAMVSVKVALFCGAVSLIVCGKSAEDVIQHVKSMSLEKPIDRCREICELRNKLQP